MSETVTMKACPDCDGTVAEPDRISTEPLCRTCGGRGLVRVPNDEANALKALVSTLRKEAADLRVEMEQLKLQTAMLLAVRRAAAEFCLLDSMHSPSSTHAVALRKTLDAYEAVMDRRPTLEEVARDLRDWQERQNVSCAWDHLAKMADCLDEAQQAAHEAYWVLQGPKGYQDRCIDATELLRNLVKAKGDSQ